MIYDASDVGYTLYSTHKDEDTLTSITTTDVTTLDGVGGVLHQKNTTPSTSVVTIATWNT